MQTLSKDRNLTRISVFALIAITVITISWTMARIPVAASPSDRSGGYPAAEALRLGASTDDQIRALQERLRTNPNDWQSFSQLGLAYLQKAREVGDPTYYQKADDALNKSLTQHPDDYVSVSGMGALELARHQFHAALKWGEQAKQINPDRTYAYGIIADAQIELGQYSQAVETLQAMVDLRPDMSSYSRISYIRELHGDITGAFEMMQSAVDGGTPNSESTAWTRTQLGNLYFNTGNINQAEIEYQHTLNDRPGYVYALAGLGRVRAAQGRLNEAIQLLIQATNVMPLPDFVIMLGDLYQTNGQTAAAQQQYKLIGVIEKLYASNGVDLDMEMALFDADHNIDLIGTVQRAQQAYANRPSIHAADVLAWAFYKTGRYAEAKPYADEALKLGSKDALKLFHAGMIAYQLGDNAHARQYLEQALFLNPHFSILYIKEAQQTLDTLQVQGNKQ